MWKLPEGNTPPGVYRSCVTFQKPSGITGNVCLKRRVEKMKFKIKSLFKILFPKPEIPESQKENQ